MEQHQTIAEIFDNLIFEQLAPKPEAVELACCQIVSNAIQQAVYLSIPTPAEPLPFGVNLAPFVPQNDATYTSVIPILNHPVEAERVTQTIQEIVAIPDQKTSMQDQPKQKQGIQLPGQKFGDLQEQKEEVIEQSNPMTGKIDQQKSLRPPSASEVRQLAKEVTQIQGTKRINKLDIPILRAQRQKELIDAQAQKEQFKNNKKDELPENFNYVIQSTNKVAGIGCIQPHTMQHLAQLEPKQSKKTIEALAEQKKQADKLAQTQNPKQDERNLVQEGIKRFDASLLGKEPQKNTGRKIIK